MLNVYGDGVRMVVRVSDDIVERVVARLRELEPSAGAVLLTGSYARGHPRPDSDFDVTAITRSQPRTEDRVWFEPRDGMAPLHVSAGAESIDWREDEGEPASWSLGFPARDVALYLWYEDDIRATIGDDPSLNHPAQPPEIEGVMECVAKAGAAMRSGDTVQMRWHAHDAALFVPSVLLPYNDARVVTDRTGALVAALGLHTVTEHYSDDLPILLGLRAATDEDVWTSLRRLSGELFELVRANVGELSTENGIAPYLVDGTVERHLGLVR